VGSTVSSVWPGAALSLYWLGLVGALAISLDGIRKAAAIPALVAAVFLLVLAVPALTASASGSIAVAASNGKLLPAFASAKAEVDPTLGTLELSAQPDGGIAVTVHRGVGTTLDEQSTLAATDTAVSPEDERLATLAGNLASRSGFDVAAELDALHIAFIVVPDSADADDLTHQRLLDALDGNRILIPIGKTGLWHYEGLGGGTAPTGPGPLGTTTGVVVLVAQGLVVLLALLLAVPTARRRRVRSARVAEEAAEVDE
jgi:hypothetical protein